jgi:hypothetical protein
MCGGRALLDVATFAARSITAAAFLDGRLNPVPGLAGALLDAPDQFVGFALRKFEVVIRKLPKFLFQFAFGDIPVSFDGERTHMLVCFSVGLFSPPLSVWLEILLQKMCRILNRDQFASNFHLSQNSRAGQEVLPDN